MFDVTANDSLVSVIVPVYNVSTYLDTCVRSIVSQTFGEFELILVDDGSTDGSSAQCDAWGREDSRITVIHQPNAGLSAARNAGLARACGRYVLFVDSDDWIVETTLARCLGEMRRANADVVYFRFDRRDDDGEPVTVDRRPRPYPTGEMMDSRAALAMLFAGRVGEYAWQFLACRVLYEQDPRIRFPTGRLMEDAATTYRVLARAERISFVDEVVYHYRFRAGSILREWTPQLIRDKQLNCFECETAMESRGDVWLLGLAREQSRRVMMDAYLQAAEHGLARPWRSSPGDLGEELRRGVLVRAKRRGWGTYDNLDRAGHILLRGNLFWVLGVVRRQVHRIQWRHSH